jgi:hypothetical protein
MSQRGKKILDERLLMALACGASVDAAAQSVGMCKTAVDRRLKDPDFRRRIIELRAEFVTRTSAVLTAAGGEFAKTLVALVKDTVASAVRLGAARAGLDLGVKLREDVDHEGRLQALERRLNGGEAK